ncbi:hypothetical protein [Pseudarthrobacter sp. BIM B-2242]|uniref:hypothetical protein n=1 Tax=Pseudarthrobacter sp. BIM B-2242 TaxID=2772401 RepID=UPI00168B3623|nr:hypothetical protein [Pseudarthrobacter sp. BIM B-2242]QOD05723.1 hypothetical protein IDT60_22030 [Pseudarthrobacter sp. BIM B-2242]
MTTTRTTTTARKPSRRARLAAVAAGTVALAVLASSVLASAASITTAQPAAPVTTASDPFGPKAVEQPAPPTPAIGKPYLADVANGGVAKITVTSATMTSPTVLTLDVGWDSWAGATTPDPAAIQVLDANDAPATRLPVTEDALPTDPVQPGKPVRGKVAFDIPAGPATLVLKPSGAAEATRITLK